MLVSKHVLATTATILCVLHLAIVEGQGLTGNKLFVFGDSYVDTGNTVLPYSAWKNPYGMTYPGQPSGRWSDGRVWSDYIAKHLGLTSPVPYEQRTVQRQNLKNGMNFAYYGTGVFNTSVPFPKLSNQIDLFQKMIKEGVYKASDLKSSVALIAISGNDLAYFGSTGKRSLQDWNNFEQSIANNMIESIKRIAALGVKRIAVDSLQPLGCLPYTSASNAYRSCNADANRLAANQNQLLLSQMKTLARQRPQTNFFYLDFYKSWITILQKPNFIPWNPCCAGSSKSACGSVNGKGLKKYTICSKPGSSFFFDSIHPSQRGWDEVYANMKNTFNPLR